jgi:hypothetical protein
MLKGESTLGCQNFGRLESLFKVLFLVLLKISIKYEYSDDIESNIFFPFPISNHDVIRHIKNIAKEIFLKSFFLNA